MKIKFQLIPGTDAFYRVTANGEYLGEVRKVYIGGTAWILAPDGYVGRGKTRLCYNTRKEAAEALVDFCRAPHRTSLVEG